MTRRNLLLSLGILPMLDVPERETVLASGALEAAEHEIEESGANVGTLTLMAPRGSAALATLKDLLGAEVDVVLRKREPRELQKVIR
jgi:hypothetical protein